MSPDNRLLFAHLSRALARYVPEAVREARQIGTAVPEELLSMAAFFADCASVRPDATTLAPGSTPGQPVGMTEGLLLLTKREAAAMLAVSVRQLERLIAAGEIRKVVVGAAVRVRRSDLEQYVNGLAPVTFRDDITAKDTA